MRHTIQLLPDGQVQVGRETFLQGSSCANCVKRKAIQLNELLTDTRILDGKIYIPEPRTMNDYLVAGERHGCDRGGIQLGICTAFTRDSQVRLESHMQFSSHRRYN